MQFLNKYTNNELLKIYSIGIESFDSVQIVSFYQKNIHKDIVYYQRKVFEKFNFKINQIEGDFSHADFLNFIFSNFTKDYLIIFDIDCIPLFKEAIFSILCDISNKNTISGAAQTANHKNYGKNIYVGPFFLGISKELIYKLNIDTFNEDDNHDIGGIITTKCLQIGAKIKYWYPTEIELPLWRLYPDRTFGCGTIYNGLIYHAFQIRLNSNNRFISKCKKILKS